jgi:hypothetical protein
LKTLAWSVGAIYLLLGTAVVVVLGIAGLWEGFAHRAFIARFLGITAYVYGTAGLAFWVGARPSRLGGAALVILILPGAVLLTRGARDSAQLRETARLAVTAPTEGAREQAGQELFALGRRAGRPPHVVALADLLERAVSDEIRLRVVPLLGALSYENARVTEALRALHAETKDDPARAELHGAVIEALREIDPYTPIE